MISLFILFFAMLVMSSFFIVGFFNITRGRWEIQPDSTRVWTGKIFNFWHRFLQSHTITQSFYSGDEFYKVLAKLEPFLVGYTVRKVFSNAVEIDAMSEQDYFVFKGKAANIGVNVIGVPTDDKTKSSVYDSMQISIYKEDKKYKIPHYISDPLGLCITCLSSVFGTILWFFWLYVGSEVNKIIYTESVYILLNLSFGVKFLLWAFFCISLTYFNDTLLNIKKYFGKE